jgi:hypothetical protein
MACWPLNHKSRTSRINCSKRLALVNGIQYQRLGDECYYAQELFEQEELTAYLKNRLVQNSDTLGQL